MACPFPTFNIVIFFADSLSYACFGSWCITCLCIVITQALSYKMQPPRITRRRGALHDFSIMCTCTQMQIQDVGRPFYIMEFKTNTKMSILVEVLTRWHRSPKKGGLKMHFSLVGFGWLMKNDQVTNVWLSIHEILVPMCWFNQDKSWPPKWSFKGEDSGVDANWGLKRGVEKSEEKLRTWSNSWRIEGSFSFLTFFSHSKQCTIKRG